MPITGSLGVLVETANVFSKLPIAISGRQYWVIFKLVMR